MTSCVQKHKNRFKRCLFFSKSLDKVTFQSISDQWERIVISVNVLKINNLWKSISNDLMKWLWKKNYYINRDIFEKQCYFCFLKNIAISDWDTFLVNITRDQTLRKTKVSPSFTMIKQCERLPLLLIIYW